MNGDKEGGRSRVWCGRVALLSAVCASLIIWGGGGGGVALARILDVAVGYYLLLVTERVFVFLLFLVRLGWPRPRI